MRWRRLLGAMILAVSGAAKAAAAEACEDGIDPDRSLAITALDVVEAARAEGTGPWSFGGVFRRAVAPAVDAGDVAFDWLRQISATRTFNGFVLPERPPGPLLAIWPRAGATALDLAKSPFNLLGIVFRPDLAAGDHFGEGRLVFGALDSQEGARDLTVIFEFALRATPNLPTRAAWYRSIAALSTLAPGEAYLRGLQRLTDEFTYPYGGSSQLLRMRTNEQFFGQGWDLREFGLDRRARRLVMQAVDKTPDASLDASAGSPLAQWALANRAAIVGGDLTLPAPFRTASAFLLDDRYYLFEGNESIDPELRQRFAAATCNGCHGRATGTSFLHLAPRERARESERSAFLAAELPKRKQLIAAVFCADKGEEDEAAYAISAHETLAVTGYGEAGGRAFEPRFPLYADGLTKRRTVALPAGAAIEPQSHELWRYPSGTKLWKEFGCEVDGRSVPVETRFMEKVGERWEFATYVWSADGTEARRWQGRDGSTPIPAAVPEGCALPAHEIPAYGQCVLCHDQRSETAARPDAEPVLGFTSFQLPRAELESLAAAKVLPPLTIPWQRHRTFALSTAERDVIGYLHGNCGHCHNARRPSVVPGEGANRFFLDHGMDEVESRQTTPLIQQIAAAMRGGSGGIPGLPATTRLIKARAPDQSMLYLRMQAAPLTSRMPMVGVRQPDLNFLASKLRPWILSLSGP